MGSYNCLHEKIFTSFLNDVDVCLFHVRTICGNANRHCFASNGDPGPANPTADENVDAV
jgi:hypothetical protein